MLIPPALPNPDYYIGAFGDARLQKTGSLLVERIITQQTICLRRLGADRAGEVRFGRFLNNAAVKLQALEEGVCLGVMDRVAARSVLAIQDTTELNYQAHARRQRGFGTVGNGSDLGLFLHPVWVVDAEDGVCLGLGSVHQWNRTESAQPDYPTLPIEEKESYRWIKAAQAAQVRLAAAAHVTYVSDRESDIYELWSRLPDARTDVLLRVCRDRGLATGTERLLAAMDRLPVAGAYVLDVPATRGAKGHPSRSAHRALIHVGYGQVVIRRPRKGTDPHAPETLSLQVIEVREDASTVPPGEAAVHWRLMTTHRVDSLEQACQCIHWYRQRWQVEQLFRTLKAQGLKVESSLVETAENLQKLIYLATLGATRIMQLTLARDAGGDRPATDTFTAMEIDVLEQVGPTLEGQTTPQKNPHPRHSLAWAAWIIARLGGWKGYASERKPGPITFHHGLQVFTNMYSGWCLAQNSLKK